MNAPDPIKPATQPINLAHEVLLKADDAMCAQQIAAEIHGRPRPTKPQIKAVEKWLKEVHDRGMLTSQPGRGGVALYSLITPVYTNSQTAAVIGDSEGGETDAQREEFTLLGLIADIRAAAGDPAGRLMQDELVQHIAGVVKERDDLRARLDAVTQQSIADTDALTAQIEHLRAEVAERDSHLNKITSDTGRSDLAQRLIDHNDERLYHEADVLMYEASDAITKLEHERERLRAELAAERQARDAPSPCQGHARQQEADEIEQLAGGFRELLQYVEGLERDGRAPHAGHRRPITNYIRTFDAARKQSTEAGG